jgi:RNA polymerase sigma factor (sigma-70 family)
MTDQEVDASYVGDFDGFYRSHWTAAVRLAFVILGDPQVAEDVSQDAFAKVERRFATLREPWSYTRVAIVNLCRNEFRRRGRETARLTLLRPPAGCEPETAPAELIDAVDRLPFRQKAVIVLRYYEDLPESAIASALGCRPGTVKSLAARALARLAKEVER